MSRLFNEIIITLCILVLSFFLFSYLDLFEYLTAVFQKHEVYEVDELFLLLPVLFGCLVVLSILRIKEINRLNDRLKESHDELLDRNLQLKNIQAQLIQNSKLSSIGELATALVHELKQPLMVISLSAQLLKSKKDDDVDEDLLKRNIDRVFDGSQRMVKLIDRLSTFARETSGEKTPVDVHGLIENSLNLVDPLLKRCQITVEKNFYDQGLTLYGNGQHLEQVFINLLTNARDALRHTSKPRVTINTGLAPEREYKNSALISFSDNGPGIARGVEDRLFDPFVTTKAEGKGTGIGLSICSKIIQAHNGEISATGKEGEGATFSVVLPLHL